MIQWNSVRISSIPLSFPPLLPLPSPSFPSPSIHSSLPLKAAMGSGDRCELPQWGLGWSPNRRRILTHFRHEEPRLVASNCDIVVKIICANISVKYHKIRFCCHHPYWKFFLVVFQTVNMIQVNTTWMCFSLVQCTRKRLANYSWPAPDLQLMGNHLYG